MLTLQYARIGLVSVLLVLTSKSGFAQTGDSARRDRIRLPATKSTTRDGSENSVRWGFLAAGAATFTLGYAPLCATTRDERCIPFVGAGILVHDLWTQKPNSSARDGIVPPRFVAVVSANLLFLQLAGAGLTTVAFVPGPKQPKSAFRINLSPHLESRFAGFSAYGTF